MKDLKETVGLMQSSFYKARFAAEYLQLSIRLKELIDMCSNWDQRLLPDELACPRSLYNKQIFAMEAYRSILVERAKLENVKLSEYEEETHNFAWAMQQMLKGEKVALPEWAGYWFLADDGAIWLYTKDGQCLNTPMYDKYAYRRDWKIYDDTNKQQLLEYKERN